MKVRGIFFTSLTVLLIPSLFLLQANEGLKPEKSKGQKRAILFLGDSLTSAHGIDKDKGYVALLEKKWKEEGKNIKVYNGSVSGSTSASAMSRLKWYERVSPDILFLALGANDGLRGIELDQTRENLKKAMTWAKKREMTIVLAGMLLPPNYGEEYTSNFKKMYRELAKEMDVELVPFLLKKVAAKKELNQEDGIHPNEKGHRKIMKTVEKALEPLL